MRYDLSVVAGTKSSGVGRLPQSSLTKHKNGETMKIPIAFLLLACVPFVSLAQSERQQFIRTEAAEIALMHVRVIDGTGAPPSEDQLILISEGQIKKVGPTSTIKISEAAERLDLTGYTVLPGLVGMHDHMFFPMGGNPQMYSNMGISFPRLYLALGVTTIRTTG